MPTKRSVVVLLVGVNLFLAALLVMGSVSLPKAHAQSGGRAGDFSIVTAKAAGQSYDVVYVLDRPARKLHAFYPQNIQGKLDYAQFRDLERDLRN